MLQGGVDLPHLCRMPYNDIGRTVRNGPIFTERGFGVRAVTMAVRIPKQRRRPRATLYSPPPSHTWKWRVVETRTSPGSRRSMTSPRLTKSQWQSSFDLKVKGSEEVAVMRCKRSRAYNSAATASAFHDTGINSREALSLSKENVYDS